MSQHNINSDFFTHNTMNNNNNNNNNTNNANPQENVNMDRDIRRDIDILKTPTEMVFNPYNALNIEITRKDVSALLSEYDIPDAVHSFALYKQAFVHKSYIKRSYITNNTRNIICIGRPANCMELQNKSNERIEFVGDGVLGLISKQYLYRRFPRENEGFMTDMYIALVNNEMIGELAFKMGLHKWWILSLKSEEKQFRSHYKKLGCLFEAFVGAIFLDFNNLDGTGYQKAQMVIETIFERYIDWVELIQTNNNYKKQLNDIIQKEFKTTPVYLELGRDIKTGYHMGVYLCIGRSVHTMTHQDSIPLQAPHFNTFASFHNHMRMHNGNLFVCLGIGQNKIKQTAEHNACKLALANNYGNF
jgi:dsRNA-specific ribonuclease